MSQQKTRTPNIVEEYLVQRIKELEEKLNSLLEEQEKARIVKSLFRLEGDDITQAIMIYDFNGVYRGILAIDSNDDFKKYIDLLELK